MLFRANLEPVGKGGEVGMAQTRPVFELARQKLLLVVARRLLSVDDLHGGQVDRRPLRQTVHLLHLYMKPMCIHLHW